MLSQAFGDLAMSAIVVALSPVPIIAVVLMLGTRQARSNGPAFAAGWIASLSTVAVLVVLLAGGADDPDSASAAGVNWLKVAAGVLFLGLAIKQWRSRPRRGEEPELPEWVAAIDTFTPPRSLGLGLALSAANPKNLALTVVAGASIAQAGLSGGDSAIAIGVFVAIGSLTVVGPVAFYLIAPERAAGPLDTVREFMAQHSAVILMVVLLVIGAKLLGEGVGAAVG